MSGEVVVPNHQGPSPCPACTYQNGDVASICLMCGALLPDKHDNTTWICVRCTYSNADTENKCKICETKRNPIIPTEADIDTQTPSAEGDGSATAASDSTAAPPVPPRPPHHGLPKVPGLLRQKSTLTHETRSKQGEDLTVKVGKLIQFCTESQTKFEDPDFPAISTSIYSARDLADLASRDRAPSGGPQVTKWLRPPDIRTYKRANLGLSWTVFREPAATDIRQGKLGNCWFASALSVLAENRQLLERIFITREYSDVGVYAMRLCKDGQWTDVIVDDRFPCLDDNRLAFCEAKRKQLWVALLEKALAKLYGSYGALVSGTTQEGLAILTGFSCEAFEFDSMLRSGALTAGDGTDLLWAKLLSSVESSLLLGCSCGKKSLRAEEFTIVGLVSNHAYSILDVQLVHGHRLLHLRNTWGEFSWTGDWNEYSECWNTVPPEVKNRLSTQGSAEGMFWIGFDDWLKYFGAVYICFVREGWYETRISNKFQNAQDLVLNSCRLCVLEKCEIDLSLHQQSNRGDTGYDIGDLMLLVYDHSWKLQANSKRSLRNHINCTAVLEPGSYLVFCLSFTRWHTPQSIQYTLVCHSPQPIFMETVNLPRETTAEALIHLTMSKGDMSVCDNDGSMLTYTLNKGWCGQIMVAVNNHTKDYLHIRTDMSDSLNLISTRGLLTLDTIPPKHRQVLNMATHLESTSAFCLRCKQAFYSSRRHTSEQWGSTTPHNPSITNDYLAIHKPIPIYS